MSDRGLLHLTEKVLGWPSREDIFSPKGGAKRVLADSADRKIGGALRRLTEGLGARVGILAPNPGNDISDPPFALVCEFPRPVNNPEVMIEAQRLAWNFSFSPLLITVEPHLIRSFTCCEQFGDEKDPDKYAVQEGISKEQVSLSEQAARSLHWVNLITGKFFQDNEHRFERDQRADQVLLNNLKYVRDRLLHDTPRLEEDVCHDLLARVIFIQFLMDRKDFTGSAALDSFKLKEHSGHSTFGEVLRNKESAYEFFGYLNSRFNGDLFAGNRFSNADGSLLREKQQVDEKHLNFLAELVEGHLAMEKNQMCLWKQYAFDVIPLEFISSIYEEFVTKKSKKEGAYYTPQHLVDYLLDGVLPWDGSAWDLQIMDPACGSAVFLVKAYQRLVYRWRVAHQWNSPSPEVLRQLLEKNIYGIDSSYQAVKVASFSLYLAMCDHIEPVDLWEKTSFPKLCGKRIVCSDFFAEDVPGFRTQQDTATYDLIIGNPPWGKRTLTQRAEEWAKNRGWDTSYRDIGPMFLPKAAVLAKQTGAISILQPAKPLLFNRSAPIKRFRSRLFKTFKIEEITNLAAVRFDHFRASDSPACIITFRPTPPDAEGLTYICPKPMKRNFDKNLIIIDPQDVNTVFPHEAAEQDYIWTALMWGTRRDWALIRNLSDSQRFQRLSDSGVVTSAAGITRGQRGVKHEEILDRRMLRSFNEIADCFLSIQASTLSRNRDIETHRKTDLKAFIPPQLILKRSWVASERRFRAFLVTPDERGDGVLIPDTYISVHSEKENQAALESACLSYNSILAVYYLCLINGRFAAERPTVSVEDCLSVPMPASKPGLLDDLKDYEEIDDRVRLLFDLSDSEWALIEDMAKYTVPYFKSNVSYPDNRTTRGETRASEIALYAEFFLSVLKKGFGDERRITCVAFEEPRHQNRLPVRLMAIYLESPFSIEFKTEEIDGEELYKDLARLHKNLMDPRSSSGGIFFQRIARMYDVININGQRVPTVYIVKPDQVRYWTRSMALRDADDVAADIMSWSHNNDVVSVFQGATI